MVEFFSEYGLFLAKTVTWVVAIGLVLAMIAAAAQKRRKPNDGEIEVESLNDHFTELKETLEDHILDEHRLKQMHKAQKKQDKEEAKARKKAAKSDAQAEEDRKRIYVIDFDGDIQASEVDKMRQEITAVLTFAREVDEVVVRLESPGGLVHGYGLAASQLERIRRKQIPLTVCVDKVAASGGYMMACIANKIVAAPFALIGSIGVVAQIPNFHRLLKKNDIDYEVLTAGDYKRTLTMFGENTDKGREKFVEELEDTHALFKEFVADYRSDLDIEKVATGEVWFGRRAIANGLIDQIETSDDYLVNAADDADIYKVSYQVKQSLQERLEHFGISAVTGVAGKAWSSLTQSRFWAR
ncbi:MULTISPECIES: protease SohB [unclassified Marinobacterium]|uniref:protease SohB n=1 Tax=unclassified Marinobacterium TaxID=2644139 RepID=UPI001568528B|nr:putative protease SohB [Marinobacterium sp. xm-a-121]NRP57799.1 putative protease SohB [Marinobacterium sp. xm-d-510]NRP97234.1 putative protease SohB [Marinobacterium sp. xm-a-127]NRP99689.1 putative protease SohB [Marinobacterium sp. xm-v-233]